MYFVQDVQHHKVIFDEVMVKNYQHDGPWSTKWVRLCEDSVYKIRLKKQQPVPHIYLNL